MLNNNVQRIYFKLYQLQMGSGLEHFHQLSHKKFHFNTSKTYFIILTHHFTTYHLSDVLYSNSIY